MTGLGTRYVNVRGPAGAMTSGRLYHGRRTGVPQTARPSCRTVRGRRFSGARGRLSGRDTYEVSRGEGRQDLDRDLALQPGVGRPKYLPHPAFADRRGDIVNAEARARSKGQRLA